jgi:hypothetical protein
VRLTACRLREPGRRSGVQKTDMHRPRKLVAAIAIVVALVGSAGALQDTGSDEAKRADY